jgi:hypothetical protein
MANHRAWQVRVTAGLSLRLERLAKPQILTMFLLNSVSPRRNTQNYL